MAKSKLGLCHLLRNFMRLMDQIKSNHSVLQLGIQLMGPNQFGMCGFILMKISFCQ